MDEFLFSKNLRSFGQRYNPRKKPIIPAKLASPPIFGSGKILFPIKASPVGNAKSETIEKTPHLPALPPKIKTKEWLKVLTVDQILNVKNRFTTSQKLYQLEMLRIALVRKRESLYTF